MKMEIAIKILGFILVLPLWVVGMVEWFINL